MQDNGAAKGQKIHENGAGEGLENARKKATDLIDESIESIAILGSRGEMLKKLAQFIINRNN